MNYCFLVHVHNEAEVELAKKLIRDLKFFHSCQSICIFDGYKNDDLKQYLKLNNVQVIEGKHLKLQKNGAAWLIRFLEKFLELSNAKALIKVDPDTLVIRSFKELPPSDTDIAGTLLQNESIQFVSGGCIWIRREAVSKILSSQILLDSRYKLLPTFGYKIPASNELSLVETFVLSQVAAILNLKQDDWSEVKCNVLPIEKASDEWAIFHPLKYKIPSIPVEPVEKVPSLAIAKARVQQQIIDLAAQKQQQLVASYSEQEQKTWEGEEGKLAEARAILKQGIVAAKYIVGEAIALSGASTPEQIEAATLNLAQNIVSKNEEWRNRIGVIAGTRARKYTEVSAMNDITAIQSYPVGEGW